MQRLLRVHDMFVVMCVCADNFDKAVLANTNVGGENCHRGAALGALMGAAVGEKGIPPQLIQVSEAHTESAVAAG